MARAMSRSWVPFVAATQQDYDDLATPSEVDAIARTPQSIQHLRTPAANRLHVAGIAE